MTSAAGRESKWHDLHLVFMFPLHHLSKSSDVFSFTVTNSIRGTATWASFHLEEGMS